MQSRPAGSIIPSKSDDLQPPARTGDRGKPIPRLYALSHLDQVQSVLSQAPAGLITDIDGTIAPIAPTPEEARVSPICRSALASLAGRIALVAALSGREALKAREMVAVDSMVYIGNFGLERWQGGQVVVQEDARARIATLHDLVKRLHISLGMPGLVIEDKGVTASVHYRLAAKPQQARDAILRFLADTPEAKGLMITEGKQVVEVRPPVQMDKGTSLERLVEENGLRGVICLGDDTSDVVAFRALHSLSSRGRCGGLALGVLGQDTPSEIEQEADLLLRGVPEVEKLLQGLAGG